MLISDLKLLIYSQKTYKKKQQQKQIYNQPNSLYHVLEIAMIWKLGATHTYTHKICKSTLNERVSQETNPQFV